MFGKVKSWIDDAPTFFCGLDRLPLGLLALRLVLSTYTAQWGWLHVRYTEAAIDVYDRWYGLAPASILVEEIGIILIAASVLMAAGALRALSYGVCLLFMAAMVAGLIPYLLDPYGYHLPPNWINHGLIAQVPALAGFVACLCCAGKISFPWMPWPSTRRPPKPVRLRSLLLPLHGLYS